MTEARQWRPRRKRRAGDPVLSFEPGRVFSPADGRDQDFSLDLEVASYRARKGQAGNRIRGGGGPHPCGCRCSLCVYNSSFENKAANGATSQG